MLKAAGVSVRSIAVSARSVRR